MQSFDGSIEDRVKFIAQGVNLLVPRKLDNDVSLIGARADGRALELKFDTTLKGSMDVSAQELSKLFRPQICENNGYRSVIDHGGVVRIAIVRSNTGEALPTFGIATCG